MDLARSMVTRLGHIRLAVMPERTVMGLDTGTLYLADLHIGKSATFRANAIPIPEGDTEADLERLSQALARTGARRLVVLGDFLHAPESHLDQAWVGWRERNRDLEVIVVRGNHDLHAGDPHSDWNVELVSEPFIDRGLELRHHPAESSAAPVLAGHLHPSVRLRGGGRERLSLPCFHQTVGTLVLPAFAAFSGGNAVRPRKGDRVFAIAEDLVMDVTPLAT